VARLTPSGFWQLGVTNAQEERTLDLTLDFLQPGRDYTLTLWEDNPRAEGSQRGTVKSVRTVRAGDRLTLRLAAAGGAVAIIK
ncbi:MAG: glycoside hydrolase family 97 C-terminal domain-containing protein, partial [Thermoguttaceae bacterium]|nr:glycoside hydrolase family 97 C-terminal domain-containing protein [Thermoguttaceae bacterium]